MTSRREQPPEVVPFERHLSLGRLTVLRLSCQPWPVQKRHQERTVVVEEKGALGVKYILPEGGITLITGAIINDASSKLQL